MTKKLIDEFLDKNNIFAVVGVSRDVKKYGNKVFNELKEAGYQVYPINPNTNEIFGNKCYPNLNKLPVKPDVVNIVVPPKVTEKIVKQCKNLKINKIWMQPGSESDKAIKFGKENCIKILYIEGCIIFVLRFIYEKELLRSLVPSGPKITSENKPSG